MTAFGSRSREQEGEIKPDKRQRQRQKRRGKKVVILVALGFWPDGRREILDWQVANSEEHSEWEVLLRRLSQRGVQAEQGLKMIVRDGCGGLGKALTNVYGKSILDQRCIFHKLQNVADKVSSEREWQRAPRSKERADGTSCSHL